jgi:YVTN family beta-propeller protein
MGFGSTPATPAPPATQATQEADAAASTTGGPLPSTATVPISGQDRVYTADQTSNTVSVIDPATNKVTGTIALGSQRMSNLINPQNVGDINVAWHTRPITTAVVSIASNSVDIIDTATNTVLNRTDVGRASHEGWFTQDGTQFWVADRGRDTVTIVDAVHGGVITNLHAGQGPSKVVMSPDGKWAYINHIAEPDITIFNVATHKVVGTISGIADAFSSDLHRFQHTTHRPDHRLSQRVRQPASPGNPALTSRTQHASPVQHGPHDQDDQDDQEQQQDESEQSSGSTHGHPYASGGRC